MHKRIGIVFSILLFFFTIVELFLIKKNSFQLAIIFYIIFSLLLYFVEKKYIISFFVYNLPLLPLISTDYKIVGFVGPHEIIYGFSLFVLLYLSKYYGVRKINSYQKLSINFVYFLFFISIVLIIKNIVLGFETDKTKGLFYIVKNSIRLFLYYYSLILLIRIIYKEDLYEYILIGIKTSLITLVLSMIFAVPLSLMGAGVADEDISGVVSGQLNRFLGFYGAGGDQNSSGVFLAGIFGFFLALYEKTGNITKYILYFGFSILGVLLTGSRTAFIALALIVLVFLITNKSTKSKFAIFISLVVLYFLFNDQISLVIQRFLDPSAVAAVDKDQMGRVGKWLLYLEWIMDNPETLFFGNLKKISYNRAPHNFLILTLYNFGLIVLLIFIQLWVKLLKKITFSLDRYSLKNIYFIIPFPLVVMTVNSFGSSVYLWLYLPMGAFFLKNSNLRKK